MPHPPHPCRQTAISSSGARHEGHAPLHVEHERPGLQSGHGRQLHASLHMTGQLQLAPKPRARPHTKHASRRHAGHVTWWQPWRRQCPMRALHAELGHGTVVWTK